MKPNDLPKFARLLKLLGDAYRYTMTEELGDAYWQMLKKYDLEKIESAVYQHMSTPTSNRDCQQIPQAGTLIAWIEGTLEARALAAWTKVENAISRVGCYNSVAFDDPLIHAVIMDMGGWIKLCETRVADISYRAYEFQKRYQIFLKNPPDDALPYLSGMVERVNRPLGYVAPLPVKISDPNENLLLQHAEDSCVMKTFVYSEGHQIPVGKYVDE